ncbi:MAG: GWxTD domain-containing protein [Candidatus Cloacimonadia bacterium]
MKIKILILLSITTFIPFMLHATLPVFFDSNRFLTDSGNIIFEVTYKVFHKDLQFQEYQGQLMAQLEVDLSIATDEGEVLYDKPFSQTIVAESAETTFSQESFFIDKIIVEVTPGIYQFQIQVRDRLSGEKIVWNKTLQEIPADQLEFSDVEFTSFQQANTSEHFANFKRNDIIFLVNPNHLFDPEKQPELGYYFELYLPDSLMGKPLLEELKIISASGRTDSVYYETSQEFTPDSSKKVFYETISIDDNWEHGTYYLVANIKDKTDNTLVSTKEMLFIAPPEHEPTDKEVEEEYKYAKYFMSGSDRRFFEELEDNQSKMNFLQRFWRANDPNRKTEKNEFKEEIIRRVNYANERFSHFEDGWKTDRGRIYIRNGAPEEIIERGFQFRAKPYIIWKYYQGGKRVYIFVDFSGQGNYQLVYSENDSRETTDPNWRDYLGPYFDENELR